MTTTPPVTDLSTVDVPLNASSLKLTHCQQRYNFEVVRGLVSPDHNEALNFGKALHKYAEALTNGALPATAIQQALAIYTGAKGGQLVHACMSMPANLATPYVEAGGRKYVELKFRFFWKSIVYNGVQYNLWIMGTFDKCQLTSAGQAIITDYKSTRKWKAAEVFAAYRVSVQMRYYAWVAKTFAHHIFDMPFANACHANRLQVQICGIFLSSDPPRWVMGPAIRFSDEALADFEAQLDYHIATNILPAWQAPVQQGLLNDTCDYCPFVDVCHAENETARAQALATFNHVKYDPMTW